jgi:hypothetical protein
MLNNKQPALPDNQLARQGSLQDPRISSAIDGVRFHSAADRAKCQMQIDQMLKQQLTSFGHAMTAEHKSQTERLRNEINQLQERLWTLHRRHVHDLIALSKPQAVGGSALNEAALERAR